MKSKCEFRQKLKQKTANLSEHEYNFLSQKVSTNLKKFLDGHGVIQKGLIIGVFAPIEKEPKWFASLTDDYHQLTAYPAFSNGEMVFRRARLSELTMHQSFGKLPILEPGEASLIVKPELIIVPGVGFGTDGRRLGRGKGFYDKYFAENEAIKIGIAFEMQIDEELPCEKHDILMDFMVTEKDIIEINKKI